METKEGQARLKRMMPLRSLIPCLLRCILAAVLVVGTLGPSAVASADRGNDASVITHVSAPHDCCDPAPERMGRGCAPACFQSSCGVIGLPAFGTTSASVAREDSWWPDATAFPAGLPPETLVPPPRS